MPQDADDWAEVPAEFPDLGPVDVPELSDVERIRAVAARLYRAGRVQGIPMAARLYFASLAQSMDRAADEYGRLCTTHAQPLVRLADTLLGNE